MSRHASDFPDELLWRYFGSEFGSAPQLRRAEVEKLLTDDGQRRFELAEHAAVSWGRTEILGDVHIASERFVVTPRGLLYAARLRGKQGQPRRPRPAYFTPRIGHAGRAPAPARSQSLYYLATPHSSFDQLVDRVRTTPPRQDSTTVVDSRFGHELEFPCPLDASLRRTLDSHPVLIWI